MTEQQQQQKIRTNKIFLTIYVKCGKTRTSLISYTKAWLNKLWNACNGSWHTLKNDIHREFEMSWQKTIITQC